MNQVKNLPWFLGIVNLQFKQLWAANIDLSNRVYIVFIACCLQWCRIIGVNGTHLKYSNLKFKIFGPVFFIILNNSLCQAKIFNVDLISNMSTIQPFFKYQQPSSVALLYYICVWFIKKFIIASKIKIGTYLSIICMATLRHLFSSG